MRRKDREVTDKNEIMGIINACEVLRLGLVGEDGLAYIVPMNFAYQEENGRLCFYLHSATSGRKYGLLKKTARCTFEMDTRHKMALVPAHQDVTMRYQCVMGVAGVEVLEEETDKRHGLEILMARSERTRHFPYNPALLPRVAVVKLTVESLTAKINREQPGDE